MVDALASGASGGNPVEVQVLSSAPNTAPQSPCQAHPPLSGRSGNRTVVLPVSSSMLSVAGDSALESMVSTARPVPHGYASRKASPFRGLSPMCPHMEMHWGGLGLHGSHQPRAASRQAVPAALRLADRRPTTMVLIWLAANGLLDLDARSQAPAPAHRFAATLQATRSLQSQPPARQQ